MKKGSSPSRFNILAIALGALVFGVILSFAFQTWAFNGPSQSPPSGNGAIGSDASNNVSIGTSTTVSGTKLVVDGASSDASTYAAQFLENNQAGILLIRDDGAVSIATSTVSAGNTIIGDNLIIGGTCTGCSSGASTVVAGNVSGGVFSSNLTNSNFAFPLLLGVNTSTQVGLPQALSVYGGGYFSGDVGIGISAPTSLLEINKNALGAGVVATSGIILVNSTAAANGAQQVSPGIQLASNGWGTTGGSSQPVDWDIYALPVQGATPTGDIVFDSSVNGAAYGARLTLLSGGGLTGGGGALTGWSAFTETGNATLGPAAAPTVIGTNVSTTAVTATYGAFGTNVTSTATVNVVGTVNVSQTSTVANEVVTGTASDTKICLGGTCNTTWPSGGGGGVTSITAGTGLSGGTITTSGTISLNLGSVNTWTAAQTFNANSNFPGSGIWNTSGSLGIGTTSPSFPLTVSGTANITGELYVNNAGTGTGSGASGSIQIGDGTISKSFGSGFSINSSLAVNSALGLTVNGVLTAATTTINGNLSVGSNKITAGTIDPLYTIGGTNYATYVPGMTGEKEETAGMVDLERDADGTYSAALDFAVAPKGSDLWLFAQATNLANTMGQLIVTLTPSFDGNVWYTKNIVADTLTIHGAAAGEVSYNLTAPRFDAVQWPNLAPASEANMTGLIINQ